MINYQVTKDGFMLRVKFFANGDEWKRALSIVKTLKGAKWNALDKAWMVQDISENVDKLKSTGTINAPKTEVKKTEKPKDDIPAALKRCPAKYREFALAPELVTDVDLKERQKKLIANTELAGPLVKGLRNYQIDFLRFMTAREGRALLGDEMGCISGDAIVTINRNKVSKEVTLEKLYQYFHSESKHRVFTNEERPWFIRCIHDDGVFRLGKIEDVVKSGIKKCVKVTLEGGYELTLTPDHRMKTESGWVEAKDSIGCEIVCNGTTYCKKCGKEGDIVTYPYSKFLGYCRSCMYGERNGRKWKDKEIHEVVHSDGYVYLEGYPLRNYKGCKRTDGIPKHRYVMEQHIGRYLLPTEVVQHLDENKFNNDISNLVLCDDGVAHTQFHKHECYKHFKFVNPSLHKVISVEDAGEVMTYDVKVLNHGNFLANKIVVHNCGKTLSSLAWLAYADDFPALIVVTAPTKLQWEREYKRWLNGFKNSEEITILSGRPSIFAKSFSELEKHEHFILKESIDKKSKKKIVKKIPFHEGQVAAVISDENFLPVKLSSLYTWNDRKKIWVYFKPITSSSSSVIINWDILDDWLPLLYKYNFKCIIGDEAQAIGNPTSQRGKAFLKLSKKIPHCIVMSGTPARSRPAQYWSMISCVEPNMFPDYTAYLWRYCDPKFTPFSMQPTFNGARNVKELHAKLLKCMLRRTKDEVMTELPKKQIEVVPLEVDPEIKKAYDGEESMLEAITDKNELRMKVASLNRCAYLMKEKALIKWTEELLEQTGEKVVIFCWHRDVVDLLLEAFAKYNPAKIYGGLSLKEREVEKAKFIEDPSCRVIVGNIQALGTGVDGLQKVCCKAIFAEFANTVTDGRQAEDRLHRGGQEKQVTIYYTLAQGTIDEDMMAALDEKAKMLDSVLDGKEVEDIDLLTEILARRGIIK